MATLEEKEARVAEATSAGFRGRLLAQGQARSMIWRDGVLPDDAPQFSRFLTYDLLSYGFSLLSDGLDILEGDGRREIACAAFENGAWAIESVVAKGEKSRERDFRRFIAAASYHLGGYSAKAYSLLATQIRQANLTSAERCLAYLMLRSLDDLEELIRTYKRRDHGSDGALRTQLAGIARDEVEEELGVVVTALEDEFVSSIAMTLLAFERGEANLVHAARERLKVGMSCCAELNLVNQWWCHRLAAFLLEHLWTSSFHEQLPLCPGGIPREEWVCLRELFIASLYRRSRAEIELWPPQIDAANRAFRSSDNMVVALPTSAGKTRVAELCILLTLARGKRVVFVTPLRALSAQTEASLERTFRPLGKAVSSLYGGIGSSSVDENLLRNREIVVSTPEKLDFALRNDPSLIDDVGLVVLDEAHMIGLSEREVRYEVQVQRLLRRRDAANRRIICLSAVLPDIKDSGDFVGWLTDDRGEDGLVRMDWRPTRLRFGEVHWRRNQARLEFTVDTERPFVPRFFTGFVPPIGKRRTVFPRDQREFCLATAWTLVADGHTVLIYCPMRRSVEPFARAIRDLHGRGALGPVLGSDLNALKNALAIGEEWLGADSTLLYCLKLGVAVHHGALPTPYRREVERLLREGILRVTIASPTLAQGLNLTASALVFHGVRRGQDDRRGQVLISAREFGNVIGRAGRAFVDVEGQVLYPIFDKVGKRRKDWRELVEDSAGLGIESGLLLLVEHLVRRMIKKHQPENWSTLIEYVSNGSNWQFPRLPEEDDDERQKQAKRWNTFVSTLDTCILGLLGNVEIADEDVERRLDEVLQSSLWARCLEKRKEKVQRLLTIGFAGRARVVFRGTSTVQRKAYFLAGVGLSTGRFLDEHAERLRKLLINATAFIRVGKQEDAIEAIVDLAEIVFAVRPFTPNPMPENWRDVLIAWLRGETLGAAVNTEDPDVLRFVENGLVYSLPWAMEAVRVHGIAHGADHSDDVDFGGLALDFAVSAVETGTLNVSAAVLIKAGFGSRTGAIKAVLDGNADFDAMPGLVSWAKSDPVSALGRDLEWPTPETHELWETFVAGLGHARARAWEKSEARVPVEWLDAEAKPVGMPLRLSANREGCDVLSPEFELLGKVDVDLPAQLEGILQATATGDVATIQLSYVGPENPFQIATA